VRVMQRGLPANSETQPQSPTDLSSGGIITGFLLRSAAVSGWPSMDVRAFKTILPANEGDVNSPDYQKWLQQAKDAQLLTLRLELLSPSVLLALFDGVPQLVWCEEPHHGVQFGFHVNNGALSLDRHEPDGATETTGAQVSVPLRAGGKRVVAISALRNRLHQAHLGDPAMIPQNSSADFAISLLNYPWRQRFQGAGGSGGSDGGFIARFAVAERIADVGLQNTVKELV